MGRNQQEWYHQIVVNLSVKADNEEQAKNRFSDVVDALQARFNGMDIYPPRRDGATRGARLSGSPKFLDFLPAEGQPTSVTPFTDGFDEGVVRRQPNSEHQKKRDELLSLVAVGIARIVEKGLVPEDEELDGIVACIRELTATEAPS